MKLKNKSILVTGGAGFIGSHVVERLIKERPEKICVIDNLFLGKVENLTEAKKQFDDIVFYNKSAADYDILKKIIADNGIEIVLDLAAIPLPTSLVKPRLCIDNNMSIAMNLLELMRADAFKVLVHYSTSEVYGSAQYVPMDEKHPWHPRNPYGAGKAGIDHIILSYCMHFGVKASIIRPFNNFGPRQNDTAYAGVIPITINRIMNNQTPIIHGDGLQTRDYIFVKDTADATIKIAESEKTRGIVLNIASGKETKIRDIIFMIMHFMKWKKAPIYTEPRQVDVRRHWASNALAKKMIGFKPKTDIKDGMKITVEWYMDKYKKK